MSLVHFQTEWKFDMVPMKDFPVMFPRTFLGKWRIKLITEFLIDGKKKFDGFIVNFDIVDI